MRPGREIDVRIAKEVFGHNVWAQNKNLFENAEKGDRPLRNYSKEVEWAMEVAKKMNVALLPVAGGQWFAFIGPEDRQGWDSPQAMLEFLAKGEFNDCGASVGENLPGVICEAALKAAEKRRQVSAIAAGDETTQSEEVGESPSQEAHHAELSIVASAPADENMH
jgi:hypothetical protein